MVCGTTDATTAQKEFSPRKKFIWKSGLFPILVSIHVLSGKVDALKVLINDVKRQRGVDAVLVNEHHLSSAMHEDLRRAFGVPVIDRWVGQWYGCYFVFVVTCSFFTSSNHTHDRRRQDFKHNWLRFHI
jgi:hypothetical protein